MQYSVLVIVTFVLQVAVALNCLMYWGPVTY